MGEVPGRRGRQLARCRMPDRGGWPPRQSRRDPAFLPRSAAGPEIQKAAGGHDRTTLFDDLGVYQVLATGQNSAAMERFVHEWLGSLTTMTGPQEPGLVGSARTIR